MNRSYKLTLLASLYLAQGLPFGFFTQALPVLMREAGMSLKAIGATGLLFLPWMLKFLWAPLVDHVGTRRQWILPLQLSTAAAALAFAFIDLHRGLYLILLAPLLFNTLAAFQDVATDGLAVRMLDARERGLGNGIQTGAYRIGMVIGGGLLLYVFAKAGWSLMFVTMAALLALTSIPVMFLREPAVGSGKPRVPLRTLLAGWAQRLRVPGFIGFMALICCYKFGDAMVSALVAPLMKDFGLAKEQIALIKGTVGSVMGLAGAAGGGWLAFKLGRRRALLICGVLQTASLLLYIVVAEHFGGIAMIWIASTLEHLFGGMATVALFTLMMDASDPEHAGTDYTLLASAVIFAQGFSGFVAGSIADASGYTPAFVLGFLLSGAGCAALVIGLDQGRGPQRLNLVWR